MVIADILKKNFKNFKEIKSKENTFNYFECPQLPDTRVLMTSGLSEFKMNVHEKHLGEEYAELFFLLPVYWNVEDLQVKENEWVFSWHGLLSHKNMKIPMKKKFRGPPLAP